LDQANLRRKVMYLTAPEWPHGSILDQAPLAGTRVTGQTEIQLTIAN